MEFETSSQRQSSSDISDEQRALASSRRVVIEPINSEVVVDDMPEEYVANQHILAPPIANTENDTEVTKATVPVLQQAQPSHSRSRIVSISVVVIMIIVAVAAYLAFLR